MIVSRYIEITLTSEMFTSWIITFPYLGFRYSDFDAKNYYGELTAEYGTFCHHWKPQKEPALDLFANLLDSSDAKGSFNFRLIIYV